MTEKKLSVAELTKSMKDELDNVKFHCGKPVMLVSDFGSFFFMCGTCNAISNSFDSYKENPDLVKPKRIQFRKWSK